MNHRVTLKRGIRGTGHESCCNIKRGLNGRDLNHRVTLKTGDKGKGGGHESFNIKRGPRERT